MATEKITTSELVATILDTIRKLDSSGIGVVDLGHFAFDRIPCDRLTRYSLARKHAAAWGYAYQKAEYVPSGNRPFQRNHKRGQYRRPMLCRVTF